MRLCAQPLGIIILFLADRVTKLWALGWLRPRVSVPILPFFSLSYVENTGAAFGVGRDRNAFFIVFSTALLGVLLYFRRKWGRKNPWLACGLTLVISGALGNLYDRIVYGFVVDFLDFHVWPVFNVADSCITIGAGCLAWGFRKEDRS